MKCSVCNKPFKNAQGVRMHQLRTPACGGKKRSWGSGSGIRTNGKTGREAIRSILGDHPQGLTTRKIFEDLKSQGYRLRSNYVTQAAAGDPQLVRVGRGTYRLKTNVRKPLSQTGATVVKEAVAEAQGLLTMPREALLLRIETLDNQVRALRDAHLTLLRGVIV